MRETVLLEIDSKLTHNSEQGNYANAAQFFKRVSPVFADSGWGYIEVAMLKMHTHCLIKLGRKREFVDMVLVLLEKAAARSKQSRFQRLVGDAGDQAGTKLRTDIPQWLDEDHVDTRGLMSELISASLQFAEPLRIPMKRFFTDISVDPYIKHLQDRDGMQLQLRFRHLLDDTLKLENIKVKLNSLSGKQSRQVVLVNLEPLESRQGLVKVTVDSDVSYLWIITSSTNRDRSLLLACMRLKKLPLRLAGCFSTTSRLNKSILLLH